MSISGEISGVSILVFVEVSLRHFKIGHVPQERRWFQSLFSWKYLLGDSARSLTELTHSVSILVFVEVSLRLQLLNLFLSFQ